MEKWISHKNILVYKNKFKSDSRYAHLFLQEAELKEVFADWLKWLCSAFLFIINMSQVSNNDFSETNTLFQTSFFFLMLVCDVTEDIPTVVISDIKAPPTRRSNI